MYMAKSHKKATISPKGLHYTEHNVIDRDFPKPLHPSCDYIKTVGFYQHILKKKN